MFFGGCRTVSAETRQKDQDCISDHCYGNEVEEGLDQEGLQYREPISFERGWLVEAPYLEKLQS
jgi:hypothetical protein